MKSNGGKAKAPAKKAKPMPAKASKAAPAKAVKKVKAPSKTMSKSSVKPAAKKLPAKPVASKTGANAKVTSKVVAKVKPKANLKVVVKAKVPVKSPAKPAAKPVAKTVKVAAKPTKVAKPVAKSPPSGKSNPQKSAAKTVSAKVNVALSPSKKPVAPIAKSVAKPVTQAGAKPVAKAAAVPAPVAVVAPVAAPVPPGTVVQKGGRPSSRLQQITVPSMAQSVASTAAKSSFTHVPAMPVIAPPLASSVKRDPKLANNWKTKAAADLTDAELIAMPDSEYMNDKQMAAFRAKLFQLKQDILNSAGETTEHLREDTVVVPDPADRATIEEEHALELRTRDRERKLLKKIEQSINRIDAGDYGYCDETGEPIGVGRLLARPTATLSLEAQQRRELKQKMFGD